MPRHLISDAHEWINEIPTVQPPLELIVMERALRWRKNNLSNENIHPLGDQSLRTWSSLPIEDFSSNRDIRKWVIASWNYAYQEEASDLIRSFIPCIPTSVNIKKECSYEVGMFISGHGPFRSYLRRFQPAKYIDPNCPSCGIEQDPYHILYDCKEHEETRKEYLGLALQGTKPYFPADLLQPQHLAGFNAFVKKVISSLNLTNQIYKSSLITADISLQ